MRLFLKQQEALDPGDEYAVLVSSIPPRSRRSTWRMFRGAAAVRKQLVRTEGLVGFALLARPLRMQYATLSVWTDQAALDAFAHARPHSELMSGLASEMVSTRFEQWTISGGGKGAHRGMSRSVGWSSWKAPEVVRIPDPGADSRPAGWCLA